MQGFGEALLLILVANGSPILVRHVPYLKGFDYPLDCKLVFFDGRPLLGASKTWRGLISSIITTMLCAVLLQMEWHTGFMVSVLAMFGDSLSSFVKRRFALAPSDMALGVDQIPESLFPSLYMHYLWQLGWSWIVSTVIVFFVLELLLSRFLYHLHIRQRPY